MKCLLRLYPRAWRDRYEEETAALLEQQGASLQGAVDLARGAVDAHLHRHFVTGRRPSMAARLRASSLTVFCAYVVFALAYGFLCKLADPQGPFDAVASAHAEVGAAFTLIAVCAVLASLSILAGGLPIAFAVVRQAIATRRGDIAALCAVPPLALAVAVGWTLLAARILAAHGPSALTPLDAAVALSWLIVIALAIVAGTAAIVAAVARSAIEARLWRFALAPAALATGAMTMTSLAAIVWGIGIKLDAPRVFAQDLGSGWFALDMALMAVATGLAAVSLRRGYAARAGA